MEITEMRMPKKHQDHKDVIAQAGLQDEKEWLSKNHSLKGEQSDEYTARAKAYNARCKELGATFALVQI
jgi:hypothetical protein